MIAPAKRAVGPKVVDLFSGAGLLSYAFAAEGFELTTAIEKDKVAAATYAANLGDHVICADVKQLRPEGPCDVLIGGPPCQGFSTLGKRSSSDPRNRLSLEMVKWTEALRPQAVVIENVAAFVETAVFSKVVAELESLGYATAAYVLNAYEYGAPQLRSRSFTLASRSIIPRPQAVLAAVRTVREAWDGLPAVPDGCNSHYAPTPSQLALARMKVIPIGGNKRDIMSNAPDLAAPSWWTVACAATDVWGRMHWDKPCNTLRTALLNPSKGRYIHPEQHRVISLREAARLHTIPDTWEFTGTPTQIARQIGNSVPPALGQAVARTVFKNLA